MKSEKIKEYQICRRCIMDTSDPEIIFDENGFCNHCKEALKKLEKINLTPEEKERKLIATIEKIKSDGIRKKYDCIIGVSGGVDSSYCAFLAKKYGLRPLAVHLDNGWNSELANLNIENILKNLGIDLYTYVIDWEEFRDLQLSFLKASTPDGEIPTDHAIMAILFKIAERENVKYILIGNNTATESILPRTWSHGHVDSKYIRSVHKIFGTVPLKTFPQYSMYDLFRYFVIKRIKLIKLLEMVEYNKEVAIQTLEREVGYKRYSGKHNESVYTKFYQDYVLPKKFNIDKRRAHLSSLICADQITRESALNEIIISPLSQSSLENDRRYVIEKLGLTDSEFEHLMQLSIKSFWDYPSYERYLNIDLLLKIYHIIFSR